MTEDGVEYSDDAIRGTELLSEYDDLTLELLTHWRGYLDANKETGVQPSVEDFIIATYVVNNSWPHPGEM
jgi:hypothetical protein